MRRRENGYNIQENKQKNSLRKWWPWRQSLTMSSFCCCCFRFQRFHFGAWHNHIPLTTPFNTNVHINLIYKIYFTAICKWIRKKRRFCMFLKRSNKTRNARQSRRQKAKYKSNKIRFIATSNSSLTILNVSLMNKIATNTLHKSTTPKRTDSGEICIMGLICAHCWKAEKLMGAGFIGEN